MSRLVSLATLAVFFILSEATTENAVKLGAPEQVHISYGVNHDQLWVTWLTFENETHYKKQPTVQYGVESTKLDQTQHGHAALFMNGNRVAFVHRVMLSKLKTNTKYYYRCGTEEYGWTKQFSFKTRPQDEEDWDPTIAIYGDLGIINGVSIPFIKSQTAKGAYDAIFHVGDIAYNLNDMNGNIGDVFMKEMEPVMAAVPYQLTPGNHEQANNFSQYDSRFTMINPSSGQVNNHFYSFNIGPMHVIAFSSEFYYYTKYGTAQIHNQYAWLEEDLKKAIKPENHRKHPWILAMGHRPMYCSNDVQADECNQHESIFRKGFKHQYGLEDLFYKYGVDIIIGAHEHSYERLFPMYNRKVYNGSIEEPYKNPKAPFHLVTGSAGCIEGFDAFTKKPENWSAKRLDEYGITEFHVLNKTHIRIKQRSTEKNGQVVDAVTFIKEKHGPEAWL